MGEVKRWVQGGCGDDGKLFPDEDGDWVEYSDYATLEADFDKLFEAGLKQQGEYRSLEAERDALRRELDLAKSFHDVAVAERNLARHNEDKLRAEVAKLRAACAAKHDALGQLFAFVQSDEAGDTPSLRLFAVCVAALSTDAGKGWIDATGAVEAQVMEGDNGLMYVADPVPADWAGSRVLIVRVAK